MFAFLSDPLFWASIAALAALDLALGVEGARHLDTMARGRTDTRRIGFILAALFRLALLAALLWLVALPQAAFSLLGWTPGWGELVLLGGGIFLVYRGASELIALTRNGSESWRIETTNGGPLAAPLVGLALVGAVYGVDSAVLAIGVATHPAAMVAGLLIALFLLYKFADALTEATDRYPAIRLLALAMLLPVGTAMLARGTGFPESGLALYLALGMVMLVLGALVLAGSVRGEALSQHPGAASADPFPVEPHLDDPVDAVTIEPEILVPDDEPQLFPAVEPETLGAAPEPPPSEPEEEELAVPEEPEHTIPLPLGEEDRPVPKPKGQQRRLGRPQRRRTGSRKGSART